MSATHYRDGILHVEDLPVTTLVERFGTPLYVYSAATLREQYQTLQTATQGLAENVLICYALKANANPTIGAMLAKWGAGADVVSGGELFLARRMSFPAGKIVFAGVGKTRREMVEGLAVGIRAFHVESAGEMDALAELAAEMGVVAPVAVRVNPDVEAHTHPYITTGKSVNKFGVGPGEALDLMRRADALPSLHPVGLHAHIGSQLPSVRPIIEAATIVLQLWDQLTSEGIGLRDLNIGGGLGIPYKPDDRPEGPDALAAGLRPLLAGRKLELALEPGRFIVGPAGALLTSVLYTKQVQSDDGTPHTHNLAIVDASMNDLLRPALYSAWHPVWPLHEADLDKGQPVDLVGPVCESSDVLARDRYIGEVQQGDLLAIGQAGAYGYSMSSQYNARPRPAEVLVEGSEATLIRKRETYEDL